MSTNVITVILVVGLAAVAILAATYLSPNKEGFWGLPSRTWKVEKVMGDNNGVDFFQVPGFQGILSPRFSNVDYGPYLRTDMPAMTMLGVPETPLSVGRIGSGIPISSSVRNYDTHVSGSNYSVNPIEPTQIGAIQGTSNESYGSIMDEQIEKFRNSGFNEYGVDDNGIPTSNESFAMMNDGQVRQPIVYDRFMYANRKSRLRALGDLIRGDLPIVPNSGNWFVPSVHPNIDLQAGSLNVIAGVNNQTNRALANLIYRSSGGADSTIGGVDLKAVNMGSQFFESTVNGGGDLIVTSFP